MALGGGKYNAPITQTMRNAFTSTGAFRALTDAKYLSGEAHLKRGDILLRESGHTLQNHQEPINNDEDMLPNRI